MSLSETALFRTAEGRTRYLGKNEPVLASRDRILLRARELMRTGVIRPRADELCVGIITDAAINRHFATMAELYQAALADEAVRADMLLLLLPNGVYPTPADCDRIFKAIFTGRLPT